MLDEFQLQGFVVLRGAFEASACEAMRAEIWSALESRDGILRNDSTTWTIEQPRGLGFLRKAGVFDAVGSTAVIDAVNMLLGVESWDVPKHWGGPLVTFPTTGDWSDLNTGWHIDYPARGNLKTPFAVKMLGLLSDMETRGGATLLARKSHHQVRQLVADSPNGDAGSSSKVREKLKKRGLSFKDDVFEFVGRAGDVLLFDPWLFHSASKNTQNSPRLMIEQNLPTRNALQIYVPD